CPPLRRGRVALPLVSEGTLRVVAGAVSTAQRTAHTRIPMSRETLDKQFWQACNILRQDDNTNSLLDYVEQISWLLFLKTFEAQEAQREAEADFEGRSYARVIPPDLSWSAWTGESPRRTGKPLIEFVTV